MLPASMENLNNMNLRIGYGVDVHRLESSSKLIIGGLSIDSEFGAVGHSDADVLLHAICDALLGAANMRDIGYHFSDNDSKYKGIDSKELLTEVVRLIETKNYSVVNIDCTVVLEMPKLNVHIPEMIRIISRILKVDQDVVSIKATTHEQVDSFGASEAIKAYAACLICS